MRLTVLGPKPCRKRLCALTRIAAQAAESNVFTSDDSSIVDDVLPGWFEAPLCDHGRELASAVDARTIACYDFLFEPVGDLPAVHSWRPKVSWCRLTNSVYQPQEVFLASLAFAARLINAIR